MRHVFSLIALAALIVTSFVAGHVSGRDGAPSQGSHLNDLISVGFRVIDPEGFEVDSFDE